MKQVLFISENNRIFKTRIKDGGASRNYGWEIYLKSQNAEIYNVSNNRILATIQVYKKLLFSRGKCLFFLYPTVGVPLNSEKRLAQLLAYIFIVCLRRSAKKNKIIIDVCDLRTEQIKDLQILLSNSSFISDIENKLFSSEVCFIFASYEMMKYAQNKYGLSNKRIDFCINGGNPVKQQIIPINIDPSKVNFVYAGTLNRGRGIETMIRSFASSNDRQLILMGKGGEWISGIDNPNIKYIGALDEDIAHYIVSKCDVGLIPYDNKRLYYNIAYPTKLSFYITAGVPYLSTPVKEVVRIDPNQEYGWQTEIDKWNSIYESISKDTVTKMKNNVKKIQEYYYWNYVLSDNKFIG